MQKTQTNKSSEVCRIFKLFYDLALYPFSYFFISPPSKFTCDCCCDDFDRRELCRCLHCRYLQCVKCITSVFGNVPVKEITKMVDEEYINCLACKKQMPYSTMKIDRVHIKTIVTSLNKIKQEQLLIEKDNEYQQKMLELRAEHSRQLLMVSKSGGELDDNTRQIVKTARVNDLFIHFEKKLNMFTPCCGRMFDIGATECEAVSCLQCNMIFCALCLTREGCFDKSRIVPHEVCPCHTHVTTCVENQDYRGSYFTSPFYAKCLNDKRFAAEWNEIIEEEEDSEVITALKERILPLLSENIKFTMDGTSTLELLGKEYVVFDYTPEQKLFMQNQRHHNAAGGAIHVRRERPRQRRAPIQCGRCREVGHNRRRCPLLLRERAEAEAERILEVEAVREQQGQDMGQLEAQQRREMEALMERQEVIDDGELARLMQGVQWEEEEQENRVVVHNEVIVIE